MVGVVGMVGVAGMVGVVGVAGMAGMAGISGPVGVWDMPASAGSTLDGAVGKGAGMGACLFPFLAPCMGLNPTVSLALTRKHGPGPGQF